MSRSIHRGIRSSLGPASALLAFAVALCGCDARFDLSTKTGEDEPLASPTPPTGLPPANLPPPAKLPLPQPVAPSAGAPQTFAELAAAADAAVVFVRVRQSRMSPFGRMLQEGSGSGFVFDPSGWILTNHHVVDGADAVAVEFFDGRAFPARVVGTDPPTDVAVLKVEAADLPVLPLGDSDAVRVGDWVLAIGNPFGLQHTVSAGIISAKDRTDVGGDDRPGGASYVSHLQTDASINPGNSGGPLLDLTGRVVGINTAIVGGANSIGFAIPIDMVRELVPRLQKDGRVERAALGIEVGNVPPTQTQGGFGPRSRGAFIGGVIPGSPAEKGGLRANDVVIEIGGHPVDGPEKLRWWASLAEIGKPVEVVVLRAGQKTVLSIVPVPMQAPRRVIRR